MATFHFLPFSAEVFDCVLCVICFLGMDSLVTFLSYKCRVFAKASHVFLIMMAASKDLFIMMKMIEYLFGLGSTHFIRAFSPHWISPTMFQEPSKDCLMCTRELFLPTTLWRFFFFFFFLTRSDGLFAPSPLLVGIDLALYTRCCICAVFQRLEHLSLFLSPPLFLLFLFFFCLPFLLLLLLRQSCHSRTQVCRGQAWG